MLNVFSVVLNAFSTRRIGISPLVTGFATGGRVLNRWLGGQSSLTDAWGRGIIRGVG
jgi:hypothetical protein